MASEVASLKCRPCEGGIPPLSGKEDEASLERVECWKLLGNRIRKVDRCNDFKESMRFVNKVADLAEEEPSS